MSWYGYDPQRVVTLRERTVEALTDLQTIRSRHGVAADAVRRVRLAEQTLEWHWLPLLSNILSSTAMTAWQSVSLAPMHIDGTLETTWSKSSYSSLDNEQLIGHVAATLTDLSEVRHAHEMPEQEIADVAALLDQARYRSHIDSDFIGLMHRQLGPAAWELLISATENLSDVAVFQGGDRFDDHLATIAPAGELLAQLSVFDGATEALADAVILSPVLGPTIVRTVDRWPDDVIAELTVEAVHRTDARVNPMLIVPAIQLERSVGSLLRAASTSPAAAHAVLDDSMTRRFVLTSTAHEDTTEHLVLAGLSSVHDTGWHVLADAADISQTEGLTDGARRGVAGGLSPYFPEIMEDVVLGRPVVVQSAGVHIVPNDVRHLLGDLLADEGAQVQLGLSIGNYRRRSISEGVAAAGAGRVDLTDSVVERLGRVQVLTTMVRDGRASHDAAAAFERANRVAIADLAVDLADTGFGLLTSGATAALLSPIGKAGAERLAGAIPVARLPDLGVEDASSYDTETALIALAVTRPDLRGALGLTAVSDATWGRLDGIFARIHHPKTPEDLIAAEDDLNDAIENSPALRIWNDSATGSIRSEPATSRPGP